MFARDLPCEVELLAILSPDGEWHQQPYWDPAQLADWPAEIAEVVATYPNHLVVAVDVHWY